MKHYSTPTIEAAGSVRALTQQGGGGRRIDVPLGTEIDLDDPSGFTGS